MFVRKATKSEVDNIYLMGYDVWGDSSNIETYLDSCRNSKKYAHGQWYVLIVDGLPVSSLIVYHNQFKLNDNNYGIGSISTSSEFRKNGYAKALINLMVAQIFISTEARIIFLHSDIGHLFYENLGFQCVSDGSECMYKKKSIDVELGRIPSYF
jgi:predicted acetyltransferase